MFAVEEINYKDLTDSLCNELEETKFTSFESQIVEWAKSEGIIFKINGGEDEYIEFIKRKKMEEHPRLYAITRDTEALATMAGGVWLFRKYSSLKFQWLEEEKYFWKALFNAALQMPDKDLTRWLLTNLYIEYLSREIKFDVSNGKLNLLTFSEIGTVKDKAYVPFQIPSKWPSDPSNENLIQQAKFFNRDLMKEYSKSVFGGGKIVSLYEFVDDWGHCGGGYGIRFGLSSGNRGYCALDSKEGLDFVCGYIFKVRELVEFL
ncbi:MAG: hypothetical protein WC349_01210 [Patescibacteria group bacterium]|jgi:hypothetical protein